MTFAGEFLGLPGLRGYWPMSAFDSSGNAIDQSGNARTLTYNGNPTYNFHASGGPYIDLDGTGDYLSRADEAGLDILGTESYVATAVRGLTLGGWFWFDAIQANDGLITKWSVTNTSGGFLLFTNSTTTAQFSVENSVGTVSSKVSSVTLAISTWYFIVGRFVPSTSVDIYVNDTKSSETSSVVTNIRNNAINFEIGNWSITGGVLDGRAGMCFLCAMALSDTAISNIYNNTKASYGL